VGLLNMSAGVTEAALARLPATFDAQRQTRSLTATAHRPWPLPSRPWLMGQTWRSLLFMHWPVAADQLRAVVPDQLVLDEAEGSSWVGITPFGVSGLRLRGTLPLPGISTFPELNVRTYVTAGGKPGIYFFSLDAARQSAVSAARRAYRLPYFRAQMSRDRRGEEITFRSRRSSSDGPTAELELSYQPVGASFTASPGSLEGFLTERYCLYTFDDSGLLRAEIHHRPWRLQEAQAHITRNTMTTGLGIPLKGSPLCHLAERQDVLLWGLERAG
jgi:uncharacterized protein YqjF (DUF2071 family)